MNRNVNTENSRAYRAHTDIILILLVAVMSIMGIVAVCVATYTPDSSSDIPFLNHVVESSYTLRQCLFVMIAPLVVGFILIIPYDLLFRRAELIYWAMAFFLTLVTIFNRAQGVKAWLDIIWGYTIQPSEFAKLSMILILAKQLSRSNKPMGDFQSLARILFTVLFPCIIILAEGETGSMLVIVFLSAVMMYFAGVSLKILGGLGGIAALGILSVYGFMVATGSDDYRLARISGFLNPELYSSSDAYQILQSQMAIGSGGLTGIGMFVDGSMSQLNYVPADWTDFIYATIGEAWGFAGCMTVLVLYILILLRMLYLAWFTRDKFGRLIICGVIGMLLFHVFENVAMTLGLMPITGIPLPFLSYGGSNMVTNMGGIGLVLNVTRNRSLSDAVSTPQTFYNPYRFSTRFKTRAY